MLPPQVRHMPFIRISRKSNRFRVPEDHKNVRALLRRHGECIKQTADFDELLRKLYFGLQQGKRKKENKQKSDLVRVYDT